MTNDDDPDWQALDSAGNYQHALAMMRERLADERKQREKDTA